VRGRALGVHEQGLEAGQQFGVVRDSIVRPGPLDLGQQGADPVHHAEQGADPLLGEQDPAVAQPAEQVLAHMGEPLQPDERKEPAGPLDCVNRPEHTGQDRTGRRILLQGEKILVELVEGLA
jgi:hypothetical protein